MDLNEGIVWHAYDLDLNRALRQINSEVERNNFEFKKNPSFTGTDYVENMKIFVEVYCQLRDLDSNELLGSHMPILPKYDDLGYESHLGFCLLAFDIYRIAFFLDYQKDKYAGQNKFINLVEFIVYDYVRENSAFKLDARLSKISEWISTEKEREFNKKYRIEIKKQKSNTSKKKNTNDSINYEQSLDLIWSSGLVIEKNDKLYMGRNENGLRDALIAPLQTRLTSYSVTAESQRKSGRTDILLKHINGTSEFIAECKIWKSESRVHDEISQLLETYLTIRDKHTALIYFVKKNGFTEIFKKICAKVSTHPNCIKKIKERKLSSVSYKFHLPQDKNVEIELELIAFHFPQAAVSKKSKNLSKKGEVKK